MSNAAFIAKGALADIWGEKVTAVEDSWWVLIEVFIDAAPT